MYSQKEEFNNNKHKELIAQYLVYTYDDSGECIYNYMGNNFNVADRAFARQVIHLKLSPYVSKSAKVIFEDAYNEKIIKSYNDKDKQQLS